jgi:hypothetical protein
VNIALDGDALNRVQMSGGNESLRMQTGGAKVVKISCDAVWREISNYLEDEIGAGLRTRMDEHFKGCKRCTAVLVGTRNVVRLVGDAAVFDLLTAVSDSHRSES